METPSIPQPEVGASFRAAMRRIASTVTIVTASDESRRHGMTMTAVSSLSMEPPSMIVCVNQSTFLHDILQSARGFCVNVLRHDHAAVSTAFSGKATPEERFLTGDWERNAHGIDFLSDAQANIFCQKVAAVPFGTHTIFIGTAVHVRLIEAASPLRYRNAAYC